MNAFKHALLLFAALATLSLPGCFFLTEEPSAREQASASACEGRSNQFVSATASECEAAGGEMLEGQCYCL